ncbi:MAG TPA: TetR/AcrR family transcriptional regulator [Actinomycetota bacterium]|nr:TetR/AcrR family transcriptional regulator [Actinomycetota bacterium]
MKNTSGTPARPGADTRQRIMDAAVETLREQGIVGTTARAIAQRGGFNQALIFYHFRSVPQLLMEAFSRTSDEQIARYEAAAADVASLHDLVAIARRLHDEDIETGAVTAVTQLMAAATDPELGGQILDRIDRWIAIVERSLERANPAAGTLESVVSPRSAAYAISAMFLGIELLTRLDPERAEADAVFDMMANVAGLIEQLAPLLSMQPE